MWLVWLYFIIDFMFTTLILALFIKVTKKKYPTIGIDGGDIAMGCTVSMALGLIWPITIWAAIVWWLVDNDVKWIAELKEMCNKTKELINARCSNR